MSAPGRRARITTIILIHLALLLLWQGLVQGLHVRAFVLPSPRAMLHSLGTPNYAWGANTLVTSIEIFGGFLLGMLGGIVLAMLFSWSATLTLLAFPVFITLNMVPKVALGPVVIVWLGYGIISNILITFSLCVFPVLLTTARGLREVEPDLLDLVRSLKGSRWQIFLKIQLPGALPYIFSGLKVAAILAVAGAVVGEFIAADRGLGYLMIQVQSTLDTPAMFMAITLLTLIGVVLYLLTLAAEFWLVGAEARQP